MDTQQRIEQLQRVFTQAQLVEAFDELTLIVADTDVVKTLQTLRDTFGFDMLIDIAGVDYLHYGQAEWQTNASSSGFGRAREIVGGENDQMAADKRFALAYHLLSVRHNQRLRVKVYLPLNLQIDSVIDIYPAANWYEREAFDLFGFLFKNHPDLRRILTDYGFIGHPLRKDFPTVGEVQMRYDEIQERVVYEPVDIEQEVNVPKIIRE